LDAANLQRFVPGCSRFELALCTGKRTKALAESTLPQMNGYENPGVGISFYFCKGSVVYSEHRDILFYENGIL